MNKASLSLLLIGAAVFLTGWGLFFHMVIELNKVLPPNKRIPLSEYRMRIDEIRRLYEDSFPDSALATVWFLLMMVGGAFCAAAVVLELVRTSKSA
jgi:hypothetical protein